MFWNSRWQKEGQYVPTMKRSNSVTFSKLVNLGSLLSVIVLYHLTTYWKRLGNDTSPMHPWRRYSQLKSTWKTKLSNILSVLSIFFFMKNWKHLSWFGKLNDIIDTERYSDKFFLGVKKQKGGPRVDQSLLLGFAPCNAQLFVVICNQRVKYVSSKSLILLSMKTKSEK